MKNFLSSFKFKKNSLFAIYFLSSAFVLSLLIPFISPYSEDIYGAVHFELSNQPPSIKHWFGTDSAGRDLFTLTIKAATLSYKVATFAVLIAVLIGCPLGYISGISEKWVDDIISRISDGFLAFPPLLLPIMITSILGPSINNVILGISISWFPWYLRIARSQTIK